MSANTAITEKNKMCAVRWLIAIAICAIICWLFPLFHVVPLKTATADAAAKKFDPTAFAENYWEDKLLPATEKAVSADTLIATIQTNPASAKASYSRSVGLSDSYFYFLDGKGRVVSVTDEAVCIAVTPNSTNAEIALQTGLIFGDAIRDGTGLLNANDYPNSQDFNDISAALNHLVETNVLPELRGLAKAGAMISFAGCAEVDDESNDLHPLKVIPIKAKSK
jgi:predicted lipoprotein